MRNTILLERPSMILATLGGAAGVLFFAAALQLGAAFGAAAPGIGEATGGLWLGALLGFLVGWLVLPVVAVALWKTLPVDPESLPGALLRGALLGLGVWLLAGVLLGLLGAPGGWFAADDGAAGVLALLVASLGYGVIMGTIAGMGRGMAPLHTLGWEGHSAGRAA